MFGNFLFGCSANREEMLNAQKRDEGTPRKNGVVITPEEPRPAKYEFYRDNMLLGRFRKYKEEWSFLPEQYSIGFSSQLKDTIPLTADECYQIAEQLRILNEQSTNEGDIACK